MHWVLQNNLLEEPGYDRLVQCLNDRNCKVSIVRVIPFIHELETDAHLEGPVIVIGSTALSSIAKKKGWVPGSFDNENFDFEIWRKQYSGFLLNDDAEVFRFAEVQEREGLFFSRPCLDLKAYPGTVFNWEEFEAWRAGLLAEADPLNPLQRDTKVLISTLKTINREYRFFIVEGKVVTGSMYRFQGKVQPSSDIPLSAVQFAQMVTEIWMPDRAFVLDIAEIDEDYQIIEINSINSAGFYDADVGALVDALEVLRF